MPSFPVTPSLNTYNPKKVKLLVGGVPGSGFAEDTLIEVERDKEAYQKTVGGDGKVTRTRIVDIAGKITVHLMQGSAFNDYLTALADLDEYNDAGVVPVLVADASGRTLVSAPAAWVQKKAKISLMAAKSDVRTWVIDCAQIPVFEVAGN